MRTHGYGIATRAALLVLPALAALLVAGCSVDQPAAPRLSPQTVVQTRYVALGDGLTAGYTDAALQLDGQLTSVPALLARQMGFQTAPAGMNFYQPYIAEPGVGSTELPAGTPANLVAGTLYWTGTTIGVTTVDRSQIAPGGLLLAATVPRPYNNLGIPGALAATLLSATGSSSPGGNSFFDIILRNPTFQNTTALEQAIGLRPTLATVWLGFSEILAGARSGEPAYGADPSAGQILPSNVFYGYLETLVSGLIDGVEGDTGVAPLVVLANVPPVTSLPFFLPAAVFSTIYPYGYEEDASLVLFSALSWIQVPANQGHPVPASLTLDAAEVALVDGAVSAYNGAITEVAFDHDLTVVDVHGTIAGWSSAQRTHFLLLVQAPTNLPPSVAAQTTMFSLDGLDPNPRGYALLANAFIAAINDAAGTDLAPVDPTSIVWDPTHGL